MAHYAILNNDNIVQQVITGKDETDTTHDWEEWYGYFFKSKVLRTSYNTYAGVHTDTSREPFRKNYAGIGYSYDESRDAFIPPKPYDSWILNEDSCLWDPPTPMPDDEKDYMWDEENQEWYVPEEEYVPDEGTDE